MKPLFSPGDKVIVKPMRIATRLTTTAATRKHIGKVGTVLSVGLSFWKARRLTPLREFAYRVRFADGKTVNINERLLGGKK